MEHKEQTEKKEGAAMVAMAGMLCRDIKFTAWLSGRSKTPVDIRKGGTIEAATAAILRAVLTIDSRSELATNEGAQDRFALMLADYHKETDDGSAEES